MKDEISKRFNEEFEKEICKEHPLNNETCIECALARQNNSLICSFRAFLNSELERQEREHIKMMNKNTDRFCKRIDKLEKRLKSSEEGWSRETKRSIELAKEVDRLRLNVDEVIEALKNLTVSQHSVIELGYEQGGKMGFYGRRIVATAICALKDKE